MAKCRGCNAEIVWALTVNGHRLPLDAKPEKRFVFRGDIQLDAERAVELRDTFVSHFATCPQAGAFRPRGEIQ